MKSRNLSVDSQSRSSAPTVYTEFDRPIGLFCHAIGLLSLAIVLYPRIGFSELATLVLMLSVAEVLAVIICSVCADGAGVASIKPSASVHLGPVQILFWAVMFSGCTWVFEISEKLVAFAEHPNSVALILGLSVLMAILQLENRARNLANMGSNLLFLLRYIASAGLASALLQLEALTIEVFILTLAGFLACAMICTFARLPAISDRGMPSSSIGFEPRGAFQSVISVMVKYVDILILPFVFAREDAGTYLLARGVSMIVIFGFSLINRGAAQTLFSGRASSLSATAARLNLGYLLIGGGFGVAALSIGRAFGPLTDVDPAIFSMVLLWLVIGQCSPAVFGAFDLIIDASGMRPEQDLLNGLWLVSIATFCWMGEFQTVEHLALVIGVSQLLYGAVCAVLIVNRLGVWPGATALFFSRIKLF